jgi:hypothetical protein
VIPSRREWRGAYANPAAIRVREHEAFGWKVHQHVMPEGSTLVLTSAIDVQRESAPNLTMYVRGFATISKKSDDGTEERFLDRMPGMYSGDRGPHPSGIVTLKAIEETEFWCFNWHANRGALPVLTPIKLPEGGEVFLESGAKVLVCAGSLDRYGPGDSFEVSRARLVSWAQTYGFVFAGGRNEAV